MVMTAIEHKELKGITLRNLIITIASTISIVMSVLTTYFNLKSDVNEVKTQNEITNRVYDIRLKVLETEVSLLQQDVNEMRGGKKQ
jgi:sensor domain CHASE-containing protein